MIKNNNEPINILIVGSKSFIAKNFIQYLQFQYDEKSVSIIEWNRENIGNIEDITINDSKILSDMYKADIVYDFASTVHNYHILNDSFVDAQTNVIGTLKLLDLFKHCNMNNDNNKKSKFIYISTFFTNENSPKGLYGTTKLCAENCCEIFSKVFDLDIKVVTLTSVFGHDEIKDSKTKAQFMRMMMDIIENKDIEIYMPIHTRDYVYIDDVCQGLELIGLYNTISYFEKFIITYGDSQPFDKLMMYIKEKVQSLTYIGYKISPQFHQKVGIYHCNLKPSENLIKLGWKPKYNVWSGIDKTLKELKL